MRNTVLTIARAVTWFNELVIPTLKQIGLYINTNNAICRKCSSITSPKEPHQHNKLKKHNTFEQNTAVSIHCVKIHSNAKNFLKW